jgi:predicted nucleic acid-binding protein
VAVTAAAGRPIFFDTSVLLAGLVELGDQSLASGRILDAISRGSIGHPMTAWHCCLEFYSVATRLPAGLRLEPEQARRLIEAEILARFDVRDLPLDQRARFLADAARDRVSGGGVYDAHIAETARAASAGIVVTDNRRHFVALLRHGIRVWSADEFAGTSGLT